MFKLMRLMIFFKHLYTMFSFCIFSVTWTVASDTICSRCYRRRVYGIGSVYKWGTSAAQQDSSASAVDNAG